MGNAWQAIDAACYAAANGRVAILDYLLAKNIEFAPEDFLYVAAIHGHLNVFLWVVNDRQFEFDYANVLENISERGTLTHS